MGFGKREAFAWQRSGGKVLSRSGMGAKAETYFRMAEVQVGIMCVTLGVELKIS